LFDAAEDAAEERRQLLAEAERRAAAADPAVSEQPPLEETVRELTFYLQHEDAEKNEALANVELIIEAQLQDQPSPHSSRSSSPRTLPIGASAAAAAARPQLGDTSLLAMDESVRRHGTSGFVSSHRVRISVSCRGLPITKASGECDPIVAAFMQRDPTSATAGEEQAATPSDALEYVSQTEWLRATCDPDFADTITLTHRPFSGQLLKLSVYDVSSESVSDEERIGGVLVKLDDILLSGSLASSLAEESRLDGVSDAARADARHLLLEGVGNEMVYVLLHDNPAKQAALGEATICIRYDATDLDAKFPEDENEESEAAATGDTTGDNFAVGGGSSEDVSEDSFAVTTSSSQAASPNKGTATLHRQSHQQNLEVAGHSAHTSPVGSARAAASGHDAVVGPAASFGSSNVSRPSSKLAAAAVAAGAGAGGAQSRLALDSLLSDIATGNFSEDDDDDLDDEAEEQGHEARAQHEDEDEDEEDDVARYAASPFASPSSLSAPAGAVAAFGGVSVGGSSDFPAIPKLNFAAALRQGDSDDDEDDDLQPHEPPLQRRDLQQQQRRLPPRAQVEDDDDSEQSIEEELELSF